jgi:hypothetical protein
MACGPNGGTVAADALALAGFVGAGASAVGPGTGFVAGGGRAFFDDMVEFELKDDFIGSPLIDVSINLALTGNGAIGPVQGGSASYALNAELLLGSLNLTDNIEVTGNDSGVTRTRFGSATIFGDDPDDNGAIAAGHVFTSPVVTVNALLPVRLFLSLNASAGAAGSGSSASADFAHTFGFPVGIDVFNLPVGVTVNAPGLNLFNNRFVPTVDPEPPPTVPEPATVTMLLLGAGGVAWCRRRTTRHCDR